MELRTAIQVTLHPTHHICRTPGNRILLDASFAKIRSLVGNHGWGLSLLKSTLAFRINNLSNFSIGSVRIQLQKLHISTMEMLSSNVTVPNRGTPSPFLQMAYFFMPHWCGRQRVSIWRLQGNYRFLIFMMMFRDGPILWPQFVAKHKIPASAYHQLVWTLPAWKVFKANLVTLRLHYVHGFPIKCVY